jgi:hypothetical protein
MRNKYFLLLGALSVSARALGGGLHVKWRESIRNAPKKVDVAVAVRSMQNECKSAGWNKDVCKHNIETARRIAQRDKDGFCQVTWHDVYSDSNFIEDTYVSSLPDSCSKDFSRKSHLIEPVRLFMTPSFSVFNEGKSVKSAVVNSVNSGANWYEGVYVFLAQRNVKEVLKQDVPQNGVLKKDIGGGASVEYVFRDKVLTSVKSFSMGVLFEEVTVINKNGKTSAFSVKRFSKSKLESEREFLVESIEEIPEKNPLYPVNIGYSVVDFRLNNPSVEYISKDGKVLTLDKLQTMQEKQKSDVNIEKMQARKIFWTRILIASLVFILSVFMFLRIRKLSRG